jgi:hypothetical protein
VHILSGYFEPDEPPPVMAVHVLLLEQSEKDRLVGLLAGDGLARWFNPEPGDAREEMREDARVKGHLEVITFDAKEDEHSERLPILERKGLWVCVLAHPTYQITDESEWKRFHREVPAPASGDDVYFGLNKREFSYLETKQDRRDWREQWNLSRSGEERTGVSPASSTVEQ